MSGRGVVLITGAGSGFGLATAVHLARRGFRVYAGIETPDQAPAVAAAAEGLPVRVLALDVTERRAVDDAVATVVAEAGGIDGLVNNAGIGLRGFFEDLSETEIARLFEVNVFGAMRVTRAVLPHMRSAGRGRIVMISSAGGRIAAMTLSGYCAGKFALEGFAEALALEVRPLGLAVSLIEPGLSLTPHFTVNRGCAERALDPAGTYYAWFRRHEEMVDEHLRAGRITPQHVARAVERALTARRPRLRYVVGRLPRLLIFLRRYLPGETFHRLYSRFVARRITRRSARPTERPIELAGLAAAEREKGTSGPS